MEEGDSIWDSEDDLDLNKTNTELLEVVLPLEAISDNITDNFTISPIKTVGDDLFSPSVINSIQKRPKKLIFDKEENITSTNNEITPNFEDKFNYKTESSYELSQQMLKQLIDKNIKQFNRIEEISEKNLQVNKKVEKYLKSYQIYDKKADKRINFSEMDETTLNNEYILMLIEEIKEMQKTIRELVHLNPSHHWCSLFATFIENSIVESSEQTNKIQQLLHYNKQHIYQLETLSIENTRLQDEVDQITMELEKQNEFIKRFSNSKKKQISNEKKNNKNNNEDQSTNHNQTNANFENLFSKIRTLHGSTNLLLTENHFQPKSPSPFPNRNNNNNNNISIDHNESNDNDDIDTNQSNDNDDDDDYGNIISEEKESDLGENENAGNRKLDYNTSRLNDLPFDPENGNIPIRFIVNLQLENNNLKCKLKESVEKVEEFIAKNQQITQNFNELDKTNKELDKQHARLQKANQELSKQIAIEKVNKNAELVSRKQQIIDELMEENQVLKTNFDEISFELQKVKSEKLKLEEVCFKSTFNQNFISSPNASFVVATSVASSVSESMLEYQSDNQKDEIKLLRERLNETMELNKTLQNQIQQKLNLEQKVHQFLRMQMHIEEKLFEVQGKISQSLDTVEDIANHISTSYDLDENSLSSLDNQIVQIQQLKSSPNWAEELKSLFSLLH